MKLNTTTLKQSMILFLSLIMTNSFYACKDEVIYVKGLNDETYYKIPAGDAIIIGENGKTRFSTVDFQKEGKFKFSLQINKSLENNNSVQFIYDEDVLKSYNEQNGTSYVPYPKELIKFDNDGNLTIKSNTKITDGLSVTIQTNPSALPSDLYVLPIKARGSSFENSSNLEYLLFIKDLTKGASAAKSNGLKVFSIMEVNDANPLSHLAFTLKDSGKPLFDYVVLFSSNINYNKSTGKVYVSHNQNVTHILENRDKYIKPLQDRGIKVALSLLGNHDLSALSNLSDETIKYFAQDVKNTIETYKLDGVFFDDEWSKDHLALGVPGFNPSSNQRVAKLIHEIKRISPVSETMAYVYRTTANFSDEHAIPGIPAGQYVDYAIHDYSNGYDLAKYFPGLQKSGMIMFPTNYASGNQTPIYQLEEISSNKYGGTMVFSLNPSSFSFISSIYHLQTIAQSFYNEDLVYDATKALKKDW